MLYAVLVYSEPVTYILIRTHLDILGWTFSSSGLKKESGAEGAKVVKHLVCMLMFAN